MLVLAEQAQERREIEDEKRRYFMKIYSWIYEVPSALTPSLSFILKDAHIDKKHDAMRLTCPDQFGEPLNIGRDERIVGADCCELPRLYRWGHQKLHDAGKFYPEQVADVGNFLLAHTAPSSLPYATYGTQA
jgi:hypothetical protein